LTTIQSIDSLERELREGKFHPVYLVLGPEEYQCREAIALLKNWITTPDSLAFDYSEFIAGDAHIDEIIEAANTFPMISRRRLVLVHEADGLKDAEQESLLQALPSMSPRNTLVISATELDHRKKFYRALRDAAYVTEFPKLNGPALEKWAESYIKRMGYKISLPAVKRIADLAGSDLQSLAMEIDKLLLYAGSEKTIPDTVVDDLIRGSREQSIWDLIDAVGRRDRSSALRALSNLISMGEPPLRIVAMLARQFRQVLIVNEGLQEGIPYRDIGTLAQIPPFKLQDFIRDARGANPHSIRSLFVRLAELDRQLKTSGADGRMLLESLVCALS
jgi:DNA polymerase III subunit delta